MAGFNFFIPLLCIPIASNNVQVTINLDVCLGDYYQLFFRESNIPIPNTQIWTSIGSLFEWIVLICMSNIPDFYFIYSCSKEVKRSDENVKNMLSKQAYLKRKR